jgi:hypothetical protein
VDTKPFPINTIDFDGKKVLIQPNATDKGKGKEVITDDVQKADENDKNSRRKVVAERTPDGGETSKVTTTSSNAGAGASRKPGAGTCSAHRGRSDTQTQMVRDTTGQSGSFQWTVRQRLGTTTTRNRYVEN